MMRLGFRWKVALAAASAYFAVLGLVTFPLFILEEASQVAMFGVWGAKAARDAAAMRIGCELVAGNATTIHDVNLYLGWLNPLSWTAYDHYAEAAGYYARTCRGQADRIERRRRK